MTSGQEELVLDITTLQPTDRQQAMMLAMARQAIATYLAKRRRLEAAPDDSFFRYRAGVFVTLREKQRWRQSGPGRLRGCIGHMQPDRALYQLVPEMAVQAATADPRFPPMSSEELEGVKIEIAILSPIKPVVNRDEIQIGTHGLVLVDDWRQALLLPKSPVIYDWDLDQYLANLHAKAGLPTGHWPERGKLYSFTSFDFGE